MEENFKLLLLRVLDTLNMSNLLAINQQLANIKGNTVLIGAGGSSVVATFASKVLEIPNIKSIRDLNYMNLNNIDNILIFSYSGKGYTIDKLTNAGKKVFIFTNADVNYKGVETIKYDTSIKSEYSFISLASTLMPMTILYNYYKNVELSNFEKTVKSMFDKAKDVDILQNSVYEILMGYDSITAAKYLESTMVESGIAIPVLHDKYDYCHGRTTLSYKSNNGLILFDSEKELDKLFIQELNEYYTEIVLLKKFYPKDLIIDNDFYATLEAMYLTKKLAENKKLDLTRVDYSPMVRKVYRYKGEM